MLNKSGFITKSNLIQPDYYQNCFNAWCAVFLTDNDEEYHLQLNLNPWEWQNNYKSARGIEILKQCKTCRKPLTGELKTIKQACEILNKLLGKENVQYV